MNELYEFEFENRVVRYYSGESDFELNGKIFKAAPISRSEISREGGGDDCVLKLSLDLEPAPLFSAFNPSTNIYVKIYDEKQTPIFFGRVGSVEFDVKRGSASVKVTNLSGVIKSKIPTRTYSVSCSFDLFDEHCCCNKDAFKISLIGSKITLEANNTIIKSPDISTRPPQYFNGGYIEFASQRSYIIESAGDYLKLLFPVPNSIKESIIHVYPGCDKTISTCQNKFNNVINYGGFPFVPMRNPITQGFK